MNVAGGEGGLVERGRFDKFTARARRVLTLAEEEAVHFNHNQIGTEHILLGLVREDGSVAARVLARLGVQLTRVRSGVESTIGRGEGMVVREFGLGPRGKKVIELAVDEARRLGHHYIGTEHLLLGVVREDSGPAAGILQSLGVNLEKVRTQTVQVLSEDATGGEPRRRAAQEDAAMAPAGRAPDRPRSWSYVLVTVEHSATSDGPRSVVTAVEGGEASVAGNLAASRPPLITVLAALGERGGELVAIDHPALGTSLYVFKRAEGPYPD